MMPLIAALCAVAVAPQEDDIRRWVTRLGSETPADRQDACRRLRDIGEAARPALKNAAESGDAEVVILAREVLASIDSDSRRRRWFGPAWTVTLPEGDYTLGEIPALIRDQVPCRLDFPAALGSTRLRVGADRLGTWDFLDRLSRAHGGLTIPPRPSPGALSLVEGTPDGAPVSVSGPFRIVLERLTEEVWDNDGSTARALSLIIVVGWPPNLDPLRSLFLPPPTITDVEWVGADGQTRRHPEGQTRQEAATAHYAPGFLWDGERPRQGSWRGRTLIPHPPAGARTLPLLRGKIRLRFPERLDTAVLANPIAQAPWETRAGIYTIALRACARTPNGVAIELDFARPRTKEKDGKANRGKDLGLDLLHAYAHEMQLVDRQGRKHPFQFKQGESPWSEAEVTKKMYGFFAVQEDVDTLSLPLLVDSYDHVIDFEFRNLELP